MRGVIIVVKDGYLKGLLEQLNSQKQKYNIHTIEELADNFVSVNFYPELSLDLAKMFKEFFDIYGQVIEKRKSAPTATKFPVVIPLI